MPRKKLITKCRAASRCGQKVLEGGCFCADHELLWIAQSGITSGSPIRKKHANMYQQFKRQQDRESDARYLQRLTDRRFKLDQQANSVMKELAKQNASLLKSMLEVTGVDDVHDAALYGLGESHQADALGYLIGQGLDDGGTDPRQAGSGGPIADEPDRDVEEGQPEVSGVHIHRNV